MSKTDREAVLPEVPKSWYYRVHGLSRYRNFGCRCPVCKEANREAMREYREKRRDPFLTRTHGLISTYNAGCHCDRCREAARLYQAEYRAKKRAEERANAD